MNNYESLLKKYSPKSVPVTIMGDEFLVRKLSAADAEQLKMYGMDVSLGENNHPSMGINKEEWTQRPFLTIQKCLLFPDGKPCFKTPAEAGALDKEFITAAYERCVSVNDLSPTAVVEAGKD